MDLDLVLGCLGRDPSLAAMAPLSTRGTAAVPRPVAEEPMPGRTMLVPRLSMLTNLKVRSLWSTLGLTRGDVRTIRAKTSCLP